MHSTVHHTEISAILFGYKNEAYQGIIYCIFIECRKSPSYLDIYSYEALTRDIVYR